MILRRSARCMTLAALATGLALVGPAGASQRGDTDDKKPSVAFRATPLVGFAPLKVRVVASISGGADDYADFYCASVEWDWADGTISGSSEDCEPYEVGKSTIQRRFTSEHTFRQSGDYDIAFRLKQKDRIVASSKTMVRVRAGFSQDDFGQ